jgi:uracil-DNA glycosylase
MVKDNLKTALSLVHPNWRHIFHNNIDALEIALTKSLETTNIDQLTPQLELIFSAFMMHPKDVSVIIIGQDPYPKKGDACGLCFSTNADDTPASLKNIFSCLNRLGYETTSNNLLPWTYQGVLLLNMSLTTQIGETRKHSSYWKKFITSIISEFSSTYNGMNYLLWGGDAQQLEKSIKGTQNIRKWSHPSPMANSGLPISDQFINCTNFDNIDADINWSTGTPIELYTDGSVSMIHKKAGYAVFCKGIMRMSGLVAPNVYKELEPILTTHMDPTSQRGEYMGMCYALWLIIKLRIPMATIISDSRNAIGILTEWKKDTSKYENSDLVATMRGYYKQCKDKVEIVHVRSHGKSGIDHPHTAGNEIADKLAARALRKFKDHNLHIEYGKVELYI